MRIGRLGIYWNSGKPQGLPLVREIIECLGRYDMQPVVGDGLDSLPEFERYAARGALVECCDAIMVLGGDGTLLNMAVESAQAGVPMVGVNLGRLGFMSEVEPSQLEECIARLHSGDYAVERRMMLAASMPDGSVGYALNDAVLTRSANELHMAELNVSVGGSRLSHFMADGIIVATPTGSTAYSLSAGGPVVDPKLECMLITPICSHSPLTRPAVVPAGQRVEIEIPESAMSLYLSLDGRSPFYTVGAGERVTVTKAALQAGFIRMSERSFYRAFSEKMSEWGK